MGQLIEASIKNVRNKFAHAISKLEPSQPFIAMNTGSYILTEDHRLHCHETVRKSAEMIAFILMTVVVIIIIFKRFRFMSVILNKPVRNGFNFNMAVYAGPLIRGCRWVCNIADGL